MTSHQTQDKSRQSRGQSRNQSSGLPCTKSLHQNSRRHPPQSLAAKSAGNRAFEQFCTPSLSTRRAADHDKLVERARYHLHGAEVRRISTSVGRIQTYIFAPDAEPVANVLLVHGWTGEAAFMGAFADYLRRRGFRAILMDLPAHGKSEGDRASLFDCAQAVVEVADAIKHVRFALGHSIGAMAVLTAGEGHSPLSHGYPFEGYALVSMPNEFADVTRAFGKELDLSPAAQQVFESRLEGLATRRLAQFTGVGLLQATARPTLLLHATDDDEVAFSCAEEMAATLPHAELQSFERLGHRAILYAPPVVRAATRFLAGLVQPAAPT